MASTYLSRTPSSNGSETKGTFSAWVKKTGLGDYYKMYTSYQASNEFLDIQFNNADQLAVTILIGGSTFLDLRTTRLFRDPSAWYHIVVVIDSTDSTQADRCKIYVNGERITDFATNTNNVSSSGTNMRINSTSQNVYIGSWHNADYFDGCMSHVHWVDGTAYQASTFGSTDATSGIWIPTTAPSVTYGTNGFFLKFENAGNLDLDSSGNNLSFTTSGALTQSVDTPSNNYATFNPLLTSGSGQVSFERANTRGGTGNGITYLTMMPTAGKWFCEFHIQTAGAGQDNGVGFWSVPEAQTIAFYSSGFKGIVWKYAGNVYVNSTNNAFSSDTFSSGDIISIAMDMDNSTATFYKNGSVATNLNGYSFPFTEREAITVGITDGASASAEDGIFDLNAGQNPTFGGRKTAGTNADANGHGLFSMAVPSGYYTLNTKNLKEFG